jgi:hypothetical protein
VRARALRSQAAPPLLWFSGLALLVAGPLLGSGYLLLLDWPSGPQFGKPVWFPLPSSGVVGNTTPLDALHSLTRALHPYLPDKLFLLLPIVLGGWGLYRLAHRRLGISTWGALFGGTLFVVNPFVLDRYLSGQLNILLAYSLLPWAAGPLYDLTCRPGRRAALLVGLWMGILGGIDLHMAGLYVLLALGMFAVGAGSTRERALSGGIAFLTGLSLWAYWFLPSVLTPPGGAIGSPDLDIYASRPQGFGVIPNLAAMYGFWRDEFIGPAQRIPALYLLLAPLLGLVVSGAAAMLAPGPRRRFAVALAVSAALALVLSAGTSFPPTAGLFRWIFDHVFYFRIYREPQKLLALVVLAYALVGAGGLAWITGRLSSLPTVAVSLGASLIVLAYSYTMLWGFWGQVELSRYPDDWARAEQAMAQEGPGRLLVFPWYLYAVWSFSDGRITGNPALSFFEPEVLVNQEAGFTGVQTQSADPFGVYIAQVLKERERVQFLGHLVAPLGVRYVALLNEVNRQDYVFLDRQRDLQPFFRGQALTVYENLAWRPPPVGLQERRAVASLAQVIAGSEQQRVVENLYEAEPLVPQVSDTTPRFGEYLAGSKEVTPVPAPYLLADKRCTDGWLLAGTAPRCHLGAVAAFGSAPEPAPLRNPAHGIRVVGMVVSGSTLLALTVLIHSINRSKRRSLNGRRG